MKNTNETIEVLNDLVQINNDRIVGYEKAIKELSKDDEELKPLFIEFIEQSQTIKEELEMEIQSSGSKVDESTTTSGKIYRVWMDMKATVTGHNKEGILGSCVFGEEAAQKAYADELDEDLPEHINQLISQQKMSLAASLDEIRTFKHQVAR